MRVVRAFYCFASARRISTIVDNAEPVLRYRDSPRPPETADARGWRRNLHAQPANRRARQSRPTPTADLTPTAPCCTLYNYQNTSVPTTLFVWKRFWRLSRSGTFEAFFDALAAMSETAHLVQMFDSTVVRAHVSAAGAKGGSMIRRLAARVAVSLPRFT